MQTLKIPARPQDRSLWAQVWIHTPEGSYYAFGRINSIRAYAQEHFSTRLVICAYCADKKPQNKGTLDAIYVEVEIWHENKRHVIIRSPGSGVPGNRQRKYIFYAYKLDFYTKVSKEPYFKLLELRRLPNKWIPEYDQLLITLKKAEDLKIEQIMQIVEKHVKAQSNG